VSKLRAGKTISEKAHWMGTSIGLGTVDPRKQRAATCGSGSGFRLILGLENAYYRLAKSLFDPQGG
jgi:hypothetical protein